MRQRGLSVFGTDYPTEDGTAVRDYIHVDDLASAHLLALDYIPKQGTSRAFNLGTGQGHSVREALEMVEQVSKIAVPHRAAKRRPGDPPVLVADNRAALELLRWKLLRSSLREIVESAWLWHSRTHKMKTKATLYSARLSRGHAGIGLLQRRHDLFFAESIFRIVLLLSFYTRRSYAVAGLNQRVQVTSIGFFPNYTTALLG